MLVVRHIIVSGALLPLAVRRDLVLPSFSGRRFAYQWPSLSLSIQVQHLSLTAMCISTAQAALLGIS